MDAVADKLKEGEVCRRNLNDTTEALNECSKSVGDDHTVEHLTVGAVAGALLTFIIMGAGRK